MQVVYRVAGTGSSPAAAAARETEFELTHLLAVALREVDDARGDGGEADERAGARVPQLRVEALLLCTSRTAQRPAIISKKTESIPSQQRCTGKRNLARQAGRHRPPTHLPPAAAARCLPRTRSSSPTAGPGPKPNLL
jgi:hypothetical protein